VFTSPITISLPVGGIRLEKADDGFPGAGLPGAAVSAELFAVEAAGDVVFTVADDDDDDGDVAVEELLHAVASSASNTSPARQAPPTGRREDRIDNVFMCHQCFESYSGENPVGHPVAMSAVRHPTRQMHRGDRWRREVLGVDDEQPRLIGLRVVRETDDPTLVFARFV
jgi:cation transport regulator ChaB